MASFKQKVRWGIVSTANIGIKRVIPAIMQSEHSQVVALASRSLEAAEAAIAGLGLQEARAYGSYEELLDDPEIDAIYNPLPNHLHVPFTLAAAKAGKHVLCEKPIALNAQEASHLLEVPKDILVAEAFMVRHHPQWIRAREIVRAGELGRVNVVRSAFFYFNNDPQNVRNRADIGGGGLFDIGCYCMMAGRYFFEGEPLRIFATTDRDPAFRTDRLSTVTADFGEGRQLSFVCGTQTAPRQALEIFGTDASLELVIPYNPPDDDPTGIVVGPGTPLDRSLHRRETLPAVNQYTAQAEEFALAVLGGGQLEFGMSDALLQAKAMDAIFRSDLSGSWETV